MSEEQPLVTERTVEVLAKLARLEVSTREIADLADQLDSLLSDADRVNQFMAPRREVGPGVRFIHPMATEET